MFDMFTCNYFHNILISLIYDAYLSVLKRWKKCVASALRGWRKNRVARIMDIPNMI